MKSNRGFTLIELTIVAAIMAIVAGFIIVRWGAFGERQQLIASARQLGNAISHYREKAQGEQCLYALVLDVERNRYSMYRATEKNPVAIQGTQSLKTVELSGPVQFEKVAQDGQALASPVVIYLDAKGILPAIRIEVRSGTHHIAICPDPVVNENHLDEHE